MKNIKISSLLSFYSPTAPYYFIYMLQQVEYDGDEFMKWINRAPNIRLVMRRKKLILTKKAFVLLVISYGMASSVIAVALYCLLIGLYPFVAGLLIIQPALVIVSLVGATKLGTKLLIIKRRNDYSDAQKKLATMNAVKIVVLGSYGKTTAKEVLATVLASRYKVAYTPGNMNVAISHARWIKNNLQGDEDYVIFELGESKSGDIDNFSKLINPDIAIVTGYAPNHIESYGNVEALQSDLVSIEKYIKPENLFVEQAAAKILPFKDHVQTFGLHKVVGNKVEHVVTSLTGTTFDISHKNKTVTLHTNLIGEHNVPILSLCYILAINYGLSTELACKTIAITKPFEHRMQAREINGAWLIDDTYNGNIEGIRAGLMLLKDIDAKRKIYVTPGLVEQGSETKKVHEEIGMLIAHTNPNITIFMDNSACIIMKNSLLKNGYKGEIRIESDPISFYSNIQYELIGGDVILMQNDWTDNYA